MSDKYDSIRGLNRPQYEDLPPMAIRDRAAQFSPFAAVVGYGEAVVETARLTDDRIDLQVDAAYELDLSLAKIREHLSEKPHVRVRYFVPDERKAGGRYVVKEGRLRKIDEFENVLVFSDGTKVPVSEIRSADLIV